jgi:hypothetical protein
LCRGVPQPQHPAPSVLQGRVACFPCALAHAWEQRLGPVCPGVACAAVGWRFWCARVLRVPAVGPACAGLSASQGPPPPTVSEQAMLRTLAQHLWPSGPGSVGLKARVAASVGLLVGAKVLTIQVCPVCACCPSFSCLKRCTRRLVSGCGCALSVVQRVLWACVFVSPCAARTPGPFPVQGHCGHFVSGGSAHNSHRPVGHPAGAGGGMCVPCFPR